MEKTDRLMAWAREAEFHLASAVSRSAEAVAELGGGVPPPVVDGVVDAICKMVECRTSLNYLILAIGDWERRKG